VLAITAVSGIYFLVSSYFHSNTSSQISVEALSLDTSTTNLSSTVNVNSQSPLVRMDLYINGTFIGSCNYTRVGSSMMSNGIETTTRSWSNGTYSLTFSVSPKYLPMMAGIRMMLGGIYAVRMVAVFQNGATYNADSSLYVNQYGISTRMGSGISGIMGAIYSVQTVSISQAISAMRVTPNHVKIFPNNNTISFVGSQEVTILAFGMMPDNASSLTGMSPPSYATDDVFVIYGLIDPTLVIPSGAHVDIMFVNLDSDMYHNYVVTSLAPPYYYMPMQGMMSSNSSSWYGGGMMGGIGGGSNTIFAAMMPVLSPANYNQGVAYSYSTSLTLNSYGGSYWYICTYPGHAQSGMYGKILVTV
jgi:rusticyanin